MDGDMQQSQRGLALSALRDVRERRELSQEELAEKAGMTRTAIANLERGVSRARPSSAYHLAEALQVYVDTLTGALPLPGDAPKEPHGILSDYFVEESKSGMTVQAVSKVAAASGDHRP